MLIPDSFHFLRPSWLVAILPLAITLWMLARRRFNRRGWEAVCDPALLPHVLIGETGAASRRPLLLAAVAGMLAIVALAGPAWERLPEPVYSGGGALVIALDLSRSMDAGDLSPSRLTRARFRIADILALRGEGQTALVAYAGDAFAVTPLTDDTETIRLQLPALTTDIMPVPGSRADRALQLAGELLQQAGLNRGRVLLITDEVDATRGVKAARDLQARGYRVSVLGVGTERGAPIPLPQGGFLKSAGGEIVVPALDEESLRTVAAAGGGAYARLAVDDADLQLLAGTLTGAELDAKPSRTEYRADVWREEGPWLVLLLLPLAALAFRRGHLLVLPLLLCLPPRPAQAFDWDGLWLRPEQQGQRALTAGDAARAAKLFQDPARQGVAHYRAGDFTAAEEALSKATGVDALYNRGNALAQAGRVDEAIAAYADVLRQDPGHEDARANKELLEKEKEKQQQQQEQDSQQQQDGNDQSGQNQSMPGESTAPQPADDGDESKPEAAGGDQAEAGSGSAGQPSTQDDTPMKPGEAHPDASAPGTQESMQAGKTEGDADADAGNPEAAANGRETEAGDESNKERAAVAADDANPPDEEQLAAEQWLRRIPDDPGGLLRRKFRYQYQQRAGARDPEEKTW